MIYINNAVDTKSRIFISKLATSIGLPSDCKRTMILFYTFCKVIRDRVPPMASNALITYLPKGIKQIYLSGWNGHGLSTTIFSYVDFMDALHESKDKIYGRLFKDKDEANKVLYGIFSTIQSFVSDGQYEKIMASLPLGLRLNLEEDDLFLEGQHLIM